VDKNSHALTDQTPVEGAVILMTSAISPSVTIQATENILAIDRDQHWYATRFQRQVGPLPIPQWLYDAERWQVLSVIDDGGELKVLYETQAEFFGVVGYLLALLAGKNIKRGFENTALALKKRTEGVRDDQCTLSMCDT
jgi:hypothetical protein